MIVNVFINSIAYAHSTAVGGVLVDTAYLFGETSKVIRQTVTGYRGNYEASDLQYFLNTYSATANVADVILRDHMTCPG